MPLSNAPLWVLISITFTVGQHYTIQPKSKLKLSQNFVITVFGMLSGFQNGMNEVI